MTRMKAIERAVEICDNSQAELARRIDATPQEVNRWVKRGWAAPNYINAITRETGIGCEELLADMEHKKKR
jgi:DNA-binding transcriptional regulator YdaS (Cro superfamily)